MTAVLWTLACAMGIGFLWIAAMNNWLLFKRIAGKKESRSWIPFLGGLLGVGACLIAPADMLRSAWWLPLLLDWGSVPGTLFSISWILLRKTS